MLRCDARQINVFCLSLAKCKQTLASVYIQDSTQEERSVHYPLNKEKAKVIEKFTPEDFIKIIGQLRKSCCS